MFGKWKMSFMKPNIKYRLDVTLQSLKDYDMYNKNVKCMLITAEEPTLDYAYSRPTETGVVYDLFYGNLHIHVVKEDKREIYSIRIKKTEDEWSFGEEDNGYIDRSNPSNSTYEVYIDYLVPVLDVSKASGCIYKNGHWDNYVATNLEKLFKTVYGKSEESLFNESYKS